jgi:chromosomal replication initiation ATPase DnaA
MVRCRPMNTKEKNNGSKECVKIDKEVNQVIVNQIGDVNDDSSRIFTFDNVYGADSTQREVYDEGAFPLVESVMAGYNGTIFAYGQTGCGKTHTMNGLKNNKAEKGIIPNAFDHIFGYFDS